MSRHSFRRTLRLGPARRLRFEPLENRSLLTTFFAATAADLVKDIHAANKASGANTIVLTAPATSPYVLTAAENKTDGSTVLPVIKKGDDLTIHTDSGSADPGYGDTIDASKDGRLFDVASGGALTLQNVTLQNGRVSGSGVSAEGGAIYNQGTLVLSEVMIQYNSAVGSYGGNQKFKGPLDAAGGGIWSDGSLSVENQTAIQGNSAVGVGSGVNGNAFGGGIYIAGGTANIVDSSLTMNFASVYDTNNNGTGQPSIGYGGGLYVAGGTVTLTNDIVNYNEAGAFRDITGLVHGYGGGIFIAPGATVYLDSVTVANTLGNLDSSSYQGDGSTANVDGTYILLP